MTTLSRTLPLSRMLLCALALNLTLVAASRASNDVHQNFFKAVATGDATQLTRQMVPELATEIDEPILAVWMQALNERLGKVTGMTQTSTSIKKTFVGSMVETEATVQFERGVATSSMSTLNGKLVAFDVQTDQLGDNWFKGPSKTDVYQAMGAKLIQTILRGEADTAYEMCHEAVRETINRDDFRQLIQQVRTNAGELKVISFKDSHMLITDDTQKLVLNFDIECTQASGTCEIKVQFIGLKGHLMGFNFE